MVEFHLSYKDLELDINEFLDKQYDMDFMVHAPELFAGDHILDLSSQDEQYRNRSIGELQKVVDFSRKLRDKFNKKQSKTLIIVKCWRSNTEFIC